MIDAHQLCKSFTDKKRGEIRAVDNVSSDSHPGETLGVLGPNGAGKTTLLRLLATILQPSSGSATVAGYRASSRQSPLLQRGDRARSRFPS